MKVLNIISRVATNIDQGKVLDVTTCFSSQSLIQIAQDQHKLILQSPAGTCTDPYGNWRKMMTSKC